MMIALNLFYLQYFKSYITGMVKILFFGDIYLVYKIGCIMVETIKFKIPEPFVGNNIFVSFYI